VFGEYGSGMCFSTVATSFRGETKGVYRHVSTSIRKLVMEMRKSVYKVLHTLNHTLKVKLSHPFNLTRAIQPQNLHGKGHLTFSMTTKTIGLST